MRALSKYKGNLVNNLLDELYTNPIFDMLASDQEWALNTMMQFATNLTEDDKFYTLTAEMPGMEEKDINITFEDNILSVSCEKHDKRSDKDYNIKDIESAVVRWQELSYGKYQRSFRLNNVNPEKISAALSKGVLTITLEKMEKIVPASKRIEVKSIE